MELFEGLRFVPALCGLLKKPPETFRVEEQTLYLIGDPDTEGSATTVSLSAIATKDPNRSDGFLLEILLVVSLEVSMSIERPGVFAVRT